MEAVSLHDFLPNAEDELGFKKGQIIKILCVEDDPNWYNAEYEGRTGLVPCNYIEMKPHPWYIRGCSRREAEDRLLEKDERGNFYQQDGAFIVRRGEATPRGFSLSVKHLNNVMHFKVLQDVPGGKYFLWVYKFDSINQLIEHHRRNTISRTHTINLQDYRETPKFVNQHPVTIQRVIARFDFEGKDNEELTFRRGDIIEVVGEEDENWWKGHINGRYGLFPSNYVESLPPPAI